MPSQGDDRQWGLATSPLLGGKVTAFPFKRSRMKMMGNFHEGLPCEVRPRKRQRKTTTSRSREGRATGPTCLQGRRELGEATTGEKQPQEEQNVSLTMIKAYQLSH